jgi:hypothetical protein
MSKRELTADFDSEVERRVKAVQTCEAICGAGGILPSVADDEVVLTYTALALLPQTIEARMIACGASVEAEFYHTLMSVLEEKYGPPYVAQMLNPALPWPVINVLPLDQWIVRTLAAHQAFP